MLNGKILKQAHQGQEQDKDISDYRSDLTFFCMFQPMLLDKKKKQEAEKQATN